MTAKEQIAKNKVISIDYCLKNDAGVELDKSTPKDPLFYLHGVGQLVPGLEKALEGLKTGDKKTVTVSPSEGYGELNPSLKMSIDRSQFPDGDPIEPGMQFVADTDKGPVTFTIEGIEGTKVKVDGNHPLAGVTLHFEIEVRSVRDATKEELTHGHVHGPGGHH